MRRYLWKHHDTASHTLEQACLELDEATGRFTFTEGRAYADWGDRLEETVVRRGTFAGSEEIVCASLGTRTTRRAADHEMGTSEYSESMAEDAWSLTFRRTPDGGLACPPGLTLARSATGETMRPSAEELHTLFPEASRE